jgi:hypothetical protein
MSFGVGVDRGKAGDLPPFPIEASQNAVGHPASSTSGHTLDLVNGLRDGSVGGDPTHLEELIGPEAEEIQENRGETGKPATEMKVQKVVQSASQPNGTVGSLLDPSAIPVR